MTPDNRILFVMQFSPKPKVKLSSETKNEKTIVFIRVKSYSFVSSFILFIVSININDKTNMSTILEFILIYSFMIKPILFPIKGIIKWKIPTVSDVSMLSFFPTFKSPYARLKVNASKLNVIPSVIIFNISNLVTH